MSIPRLAAFGVAVIFLFHARINPAAAADITIDCAKTHQTIHGFGSAFVGYKDAYKDAQFRDGYVNDLGATIIRVDMEARVCREVATPEEIKWQDFDWSRNQVLESVAATRELNPKEILVIGSFWTPPHWMKEGAKIKYGDESCGGKLREDKIPYFAKFVAEYVKGIKAKFGFDIYALSLQNELLFAEPYKSCVYTADRYVKTVMAVGAEFVKQGIKTKIMGPEDMTMWPDRDKPFIKPLMDDPKGREYLDFFCSHGYADGVQSEGGVNGNTVFWNSIKRYDKELWMTETSGETTSWLGKGKKPGAIGLAGKIHNGLVYGNVSGWVYWGTCDNPSTEYSLYDKTTPTKKYYASRQYYKFIRPGSVRVDAGPDGNDNLNVSAFTNADDKTLTIVLINRADSRASISLAIKAGPTLQSFGTYRSSAEEDCKDVGPTKTDGGSANLELPPQSIVTLYGKAM
jgi:O-glycosyl hydrolase